MKLLSSSLILVLSISSSFAQKSSVWRRAYTFEESFVEMNSNIVVGGDIGRVRFRWVFDEPQQLGAGSKVNYKSRLETIEFRCADKFYRMYEVIFLDSAGTSVYSERMRSPYEWHRLRHDGPLRTMFDQACRLIDAELNPREATKSQEEVESERFYRFLRSIKKTLATARDFRPVIQRFFAPHFLKTYLDDDERNWFYNLNRDTAAKANHADLERFYTALLNAGYLTSLYLVHQTPAPKENVQTELAPDPKVIPPDIYQLINNHPYTRTYRPSGGNYDYLAERIDNISRMRDYTDLLEKIVVAMRRHLAGMAIERPSRYDDLMLGETNSRVCTNEYLGLPKGTKVYAVDLHPLRLEVAEIKGQLKIISASEFSQ